MENSLYPKFERRYDIDWLRIIATIVIFFFHSARAFDDLSWELKNNQSEIGFTIFTVFTSAWIMPLFFVLSGMSIFYALEKRTPKNFIKERSKRLILPYFFGICTILSVHVYYEALYGNGIIPPFSGTFLEFYFFYYFTKGIYGFGGYFPLGGIYLWYLFFLFIFSIITLKAFLNLRKESNQSKILKLALFCSKPGGIFILVIPMIILQIIGAIIFPFLILAGWSFLVHFCIFIYGYIFASNSQFKKAIEKHLIVSSIFGIILSIILIFMYLTFTDPLLFLIMFGIIWPFNCLCWLITIIGLGIKFLNKDHKYLSFLNDLVLPFYILHQTIIIAVDYYVINLDTLVLIKFLMVVPIAFFITIGIVLLIRRVNFMRFLFGMRLKND